MQWEDEGIVLARRAHSEHAVIAELFTPGHGRHAGLVRGGTSRKFVPVLQPGAQVTATWRARLEDHLGIFTVEPLRSRQAAILGNRRVLSGVAAATALLVATLPERQPYPELYQRTQALMDLTDQPDLWPLAYVQWEVHLLAAIGFGLDLSACAVLGDTSEPLTFISPRSGRAVSRTGAGDWADRLLPLPACLSGHGTGDDDDIASGLRVTGYFLRKNIAGDGEDTPLPAARERFVNLFIATL